MVDPHKNPLIEAIAKVSWEAEPHKLLGVAGYPTEWDGQPLIVKRDKWRLAIKMVAEFSRVATSADISQRLKKEIIDDNKAAMLTF